MRKRIAETISKNGNESGDHGSWPTICKSISLSLYLSRLDLTHKRIDYTQTINKCNKISYTIFCEQEYMLATYKTYTYTNSFLLHSFIRSSSKRAPNGQFSNLILLLLREWRWIYVNVHECVCVCGVYESNRMALLSSHIRSHTLTHSFVFVRLFSFLPMFYLTFSVFLFGIVSASLPLAHTNDPLTLSTPRPYYKIKNSDSAPKRAVSSRKRCSLSPHLFASRSLPRCILKIVWMFMKKTCFQ